MWEKFLSTTDLASRIIDFHRLTKKKIFESKAKEHPALIFFKAGLFLMILQTLVRHWSIAITRLVIDPSETRLSEARGIRTVVCEAGWLSLVGEIMM